MWLQMPKLDWFVFKTEYDCQHHMQHTSGYLLKAVQQRDNFIQSAKLNEKRLKKCQDSEAGRNGLVTALYRHSPKDTDKTATPITR
jgi:hypothetical protein